MGLLAKQDVVGRGLAEVIILQPDKPISMAGQSYSGGYVRLDNGVLIELDSSEAPCSLDPARLKQLPRDSAHEQTFKPAIGQKVVDLLWSEDFAGICVLLESGSAVAFVPGLFWIAPFLQKSEEVPISGAKSVWQE